MGKHGKKQSQRQQRSYGQRSSHFSPEGDDFDESEQYPLTAPSLSTPNSSLANDGEEDVGHKQQEDNQQQKNYQNPSVGNIIPSKFLLYQQSVQSPKGDVSYLQKFFLMYVGGRVPLHLQEDFCGTAFLSTEWIRADPRRTAVSLDLDLEALRWCIENNIDEIGVDRCSRISLFHGNVLHPHKAKLINLNPEDYIQKVAHGDGEDHHIQDATAKTSLDSAACFNNGILKKDVRLPARDIVCAFNYSCCCLHNRKELVSYFKNVLDALSKKGGIFVMDLYGGTSSEHELRLQRRFPNFTYIWEQGEFDIIQRKTKISLHFHIHEPQRKIRHAFSYNWRLWSLAEIRDGLEEAGFRSIHFWIREMPDTKELKSAEGFGPSRDALYEEVSSFRQQDAWNAYVVAVA
ncbi:hypothetical protein Nepgr_000295 [Nepenthes gracilis]|uniref:S-adenosyl-L-methionine-dependent methyltransferase n=1 Tax=Nepenthes gracilis TaxID=150966 RepID=A0AAD3P2Z4_NEPGR|nr:hypothetical protein Nepgr_000295 [Nepenthes gracilis]